MKPKIEKNVNAESALRQISSEALSKFINSRRQIHFDFHTPDSMPDFLKNFSADEFVKILKAANVLGIKFFAKCHYGNSYYFTGAGKRHPQLKFDLLREIIDVCRNNDILCYIYYSVLSDQDAARKHPEWRQVTETGEPAYLSMQLCPNSKYVDELFVPQIEELCKEYKTDGFFLDIVFPITDKMTCFCPECRRKFKQQTGMDLSKELILREPRLLNAFMVRSTAQMMEKITAARDLYAPEMLIISNHGCVLEQFKYDDEHPLIYASDVGCSEAQPSVLGNYAVHEHYGRYFAAKGIPFEIIPVIFMWGWGEHTLKPLAQMNYENALIISHGGVINLGDHFAADGKLHPKVYERIGQSFAFVKEREQFLVDAVPVRYAAVLNRADDVYFNRAVHGAEKMLADVQIQTDVIDNTMLDCLDRYKILIIPDRTVNKGSLSRPGSFLYGIPPMPESSVGKIAQWVEDGGRLIVTGNAFDGEAGNSLVEQLLGVRIKGRAADFGYIVGHCGNVPDAYDGFPLQIRSTIFEAETIGAKVIIHWEKKACPVDSSEQLMHAPIYPPGGGAGGEFLFRNRYGKGEVIYFAAPLFLDYTQTNHPWLKEIFLHVTKDIFHDSPVVLNDSLPSLRTNLRRRHDGTLFLDLMYAHIEQPVMQYHDAFGRSNYPVIEREYPLKDVMITVRGVRAKTVTLEPGNRKVVWHQKGNSLVIAVQEIRTYDILCIAPE
ncbi:MAG: alpha-amylase family protein [Lentisphaerota bacterium]